MQNHSRVESGDLNAWCKAPHEFKQSPLKANTHTSE
jgi:hypothetical protein